MSSRRLAGRALAPRALAQGWQRSVDYGWALREIGRGLARPQLPARFERGSRSPVLLLPGVLENWIMMRAIAERLNAEGHPVHALPELRRNTIGVVQASALGSAYLAAHELEQVTLVAHSKGGLIGKHMLADAAGPSRITALVTVATPFAGSSLARLIPHRTIRALSPNDATILDLGAQSAVNPRITSIYPSFDPHIPSGSHLSGARNIELPAAGHFRVLGDPRVIDAVARAVASEPEQ